MSVRNVIQAAAGRSRGKTYIEDVFSTYLYTGNGAAQSINNGIALADGPADGVVLHLTGDTLTDSAPVPNTITAYGNAQVSTSIKKYGTGSLAFDGSGDYLKCTTVPIGSGDFTIEFWMYTGTSGTETYTDRLIRYGPNNAAGNLQILLDSTHLRVDFGASVVITGSANVVTSSWNHIALTRSGTSVKLFVNGTQDGSTATSSSDISQTALEIAYDSSLGSASEYTGYIDDLRITKGYARYTANFTPPTQALPLDTFVTGKGGMVWFKTRGTGHASIQDTTRGVKKSLVPALTNAQATEGGGLLTFNSNGFSLSGVDTVQGSTNDNGANYASWTFRKAPKFFDIVTWTGDGTNNRSIAHNLGQAPGMIIVKSATSVENWNVYQRSIANPLDNILFLNSTSATTNLSGYWGSTAPTSTTFNVGSYSGVNQSGQTYVAYLFAHDTTTDGLIQCGSFTTDGSGNATVNLGWEPQWLMTKVVSSGSTGGWAIYDSMRGFSLTGYNYLQANASNAEASSSPYFQPTATGFASVSGSPSKTFIYMAIRRGPMKVPTDGTKVFSSFTGSFFASNNINTNFPADLSITKRRNAVSDCMFNTRLIGFTNSDPYTNSPLLSSTNTNAQDTFSAPCVYDVWNNSLKIGGQFDSFLIVNYLFKRAPGFFDVVCYTGTGATNTINHSLGVVPELWFVKKRSSSGNWMVGGKVIGDAYSSNVVDNYMFLDITLGRQANSNHWLSPTSTTFGIGSSWATTSEVNASGATYVAYLFASCPGVSKVGYYTGNGSSQTINCGFTNGARFFLVKATSTTGNWWVYDTARGVVAAADPTLALNTTAAEVTSADAVDPDSTGIIVNQEATCSINANGASYIYLAIA